MKYILFNLTLLLIIFYLINQISGNYIIKKVKDLFYKENPNRFYENVTLPYGHSKKINDFLKNMITKKPYYTNCNVKSKTYKVNEKENINIKNFLKRKFKSGSKEIKNIHIVDLVHKKPLFYQIKKGFQFKPLIVIGEYYYNKKLIGVVKLQMELCFIIEKNGNLFINPNKFNKNCGTYLINRIFLIDFNNELKLKKNSVEESSNVEDVSNVDESSKVENIKEKNIKEKKVIPNNSCSITISSIMSEDLQLSSDINSSLLSFSSI